MQMAMKCILCVDDDPSALELRKLLLGAAGYSVLTAESGTEALEVLANGANIDLALLDYMMPGRNGDELAEKLRREHPGIPLVAVSAVGQLPEAFLNILDSRVQKGQDPEVLLSTVSNVLARSETGQAQTVRPRQAFRQGPFCAWKTRSGFLPCGRSCSSQQGLQC
jgi:CheY-like chemotaxis protein